MGGTNTVDHYALAFLEMEGSIAVLDRGVRCHVAVEADGCCES